MQLYIPTLGTQLVLDSDWTFLLAPEDRNKTLYELLGKYQDQDFYHGAKPTWVNVHTPNERITISRRALNIEEEKMWAPREFTLPRGTLLQVDRIYIRKGMDDFDSITFTMPGKKVVVDGMTVRRQVRFWVPLDHANNIHFTLANHD